MIETNSKGKECLHFKTKGCIANIMSHRIFNPLHKNNASALRRIFDPAELISDSTE